MILLAIDPGSEQSAYALLSDGKILDFEKVPNAELLRTCHENGLGSYYIDHLAIETIVSRGIMPNDAVRTAVWVGRFCQAFGALDDSRWTEIPRHKILGHFCGQYGNDKAIRDAMIARYGGESALDNGGKCPACKGRKGKRENCAACGCSGREHEAGPLFEFERDLWSALAVGCYWEDCCKSKVPAGDAT